MVVLADTTLFIDFFGKHPGALRFLDQEDLILTTSWITVGELKEGWRISNPGGQESEFMKALASMRIYPCNEMVAERYGELRAQLRAGGKMIGQNDSWIAATALAFGLPVVTRNLDEFNRVPRLEVITY